MSNTTPFNEIGPSAESQQQYDIAERKGLMERAAAFADFVLANSLGEEEQ